MNEVSAHQPMKGPQLEEAELPAPSKGAPQLHAANAWAHPVPFTLPPSLPTHHTHAHAYLPTQVRTLTNVM